MERGERVHQLLVLAAACCNSPTGLGEIVEVSFHVRANTLGELVGQFDPVLQHQHGEDLRRHGREPQPEILVRVERLPSSSTIFSSDSIHDLARWQFCSTTQSPLVCPASTSASATGP